MERETLALLAGLADGQDRLAAVARITVHLGAAAVYVFVPHPDVAGRLIPAPGFTSTVPSSKGWRDLLARCAAPGVHSGSVAFPTPAVHAAAVGYAYPGVCFVVIGSDQPDLTFQDAVSVVAPLLAGVFGAQAAVVRAQAELEVAREATSRASALAIGLDLARVEAQRATRAKDEFLAMLGHELRNPLAPIVTALQLMRREGTPSRAHEVLERQVGHLQRLVDDLLDVYRITRGKVELHKEHVEIATVVTRALEIAAPMLEQQRSVLVVEVPASGLLVDGDPARLGQILSNLVTNAAKYSDPGTKIRVFAERAGSYVRVSVEDQGIGIATGYLDRVFEQFVQVPQGVDRGVGGLGLGLAIVRNLVTMHGGTVTAFSEGPGRGSRFVVELPAYDGVIVVPAAPEAASPRKPTSAAVLVVDDNCDAAEMLGEVLEKSFGYRVCIVHSGPDALEALSSFTPDAALLDLGLPVMDGYELARELRGKLPDLRMIAVTGYGQPNDRERTRAAGFDAHLVKPVALARIAETLDSLLGP